MNTHPAFEVPLTGDTAVIACHFNPTGYLRPRHNLRTFLDRLASQSVPLFMAELTYADAAPYLPTGSARVLQLRTSADNLLFHKENLLNLAERIVPVRFTKLVWLDAECLLHRHDWLQKASTALNSMAVVQPWHRGIVTDSAGREAALLNSTGYGRQIKDPRSGRSGYDPYHPGFATAARRELWSAHGGLFESPICCADVLMALGILSRLNSGDGGFATVLPQTYAALTRWSASVHPWARTIGCVHGDITHLWHGDLACRHYDEQPGMLHRFDPEKHVRHRADGLLEWTADARSEIPETVRAIAGLFGKRKEDG